MFAVERITEDGKTVFDVEGRLDAVTAPLMEEALADCLDGSCDVILNFEKVQYISSAGLRVLIEACHALEGKAKLKILHVNDFVMEVFDVVGLSYLASIE